MRVYGTSPLYNYVELIFRSKRLFIASIVLATAVMAVSASLRAKKYTASALVFITGTKETGVVAANDQAGVNFKMNILDLMRRDPNKMKDMFREAGLDRGMTPEEFDKFSKDANAALGFALANGNVLEITCTWKDEKCVDIINAFYSYYTRYVVEQSTVVNQLQTSLITGLLEEYIHKEKEIENTVTAYNEKSLGHPYSTDFAGANTNYAALMQVVQGLEERLAGTRQSIVSLQSQLAKTPKQIDTYVDTAPRGEDTEHQSLVGQRAQLTLQKETLLQKVTDRHPSVVMLDDQLKRINDRLAVLDKNKPKGDVPVKRRTELNPEWQRLNSQLTDQQVQAHGLETYIAKGHVAVEKARQQALESPKRQQDFKWMTTDMAMYQSIRENLAAQLESAKMSELKEKRLRQKEMEMIVHPTAEPEAVSSKRFLMVALGPLLGILIAFSFSLMTETLDHSLRTPLEVEKHLGKPVLAVLPHFETPRGMRRKQLSSAKDVQRPSLPSS